MSFQEILLQAQNGSDEAAEEILCRHKSLLLKESICHGLLDEDLYQELCITLLKCIRNFHI